MIWRPVLEDHDPHPIHRHDSLWWFLDETGEEEFGPYSNEADCQAGLGEYAIELLQDDPL